MECVGVIGSRKQYAHWFGIQIRIIEPFHDCGREMRLVASSIARRGRSRFAGQSTLISHDDAEVIGKAISFGLGPWHRQMGPATKYCMFNHFICNRK